MKFKLFIIIVILSHSITAQIIKEGEWISDDGYTTAFLSVDSNGNIISEQLASPTQVLFKKIENNLYISDSFRADSNFPFQKTENDKKIYIRINSKTDMVLSRKGGASPTSFYWNSTKKKKSGSDCSLAQKYKDKAFSSSSAQGTEYLFCSRLALVICNTSDQDVVNSEIEQTVSTIKLTTSRADCPCPDVIPLSKW